MPLLPEAMLRAREHRDYAIRCDSCGASTKVPKGLGRVWEWAKDESARSLVAGILIQGEKLEGLTLTSAHGTALKAENRTTLSSAEAIIQIVAHQPGRRRVRILGRSDLAVAVGRERRDHRRLGVTLAADHWRRDH